MARWWSSLLLLVVVAGIGMISLSYAADLSSSFDPDAEAEIACPGLPPAPVRGSFDFEDCKNMAAGEQCDAECAEGFDGIVTATCTADGSFHVTGSCEARQGGAGRCTRSPRIPGGRFRCTERTDTSICTGTCSRRFLPRGDLTSTCSAPTWSTVTGSCLRACTRATVNPANGVYDCLAAPGVGAGETCQGTCNAGFGPDQTAGGPQLPCTDRGRWGPQTGACVPVCLASGLPAAPSNSAWASSGCDNVYTGATCSATCAADYAGTVTTTCTDGQWGPASGQCILQVCKAADLPAPSPAGSTWPGSGCDNQLAGQTCTGSCPAGYSGSISVTCNSNAGGPPTWGTPTSTCQQSCVAAPPRTSNATFTSCTNRPEGNVCTGSCVGGTGYATGEQPTATCTAGSWSVTGGCRGRCNGWSIGNAQCGAGGLENDICPSTCPNDSGKQAKCNCITNDGGATYQCEQLSSPVFCLCASNCTGFT